MIELHGKCCYCKTGVKILYDMNNPFTSTPPPPLTFCSNDCYKDFRNRIPFDPIVDRFEILDL